MSGDVLRLTFLIENTSCADDILPEHGMSIHLATPRWQGLYDTGQTSRICENAFNLGVRLDRLDWIALSHGHYDHTGGLAPVLQQAPGRIPVHAGATAFAPKFARREDGNVYPNGIPAARADLLPLAAAIHEHAQECAPLAEAVWLTGPAPMRNPYESVFPRYILPDASAPGTYHPDPFEDERTLVVDTPAGLVVLTGCAHRGPVNILEHTLALFPGRSIRAVFGGFHLNYATAEALEDKAQTLARLNIPLIGLAHCTGGKATRYLREKLGARCVLCPAGSTFELPLA